MKVCPGLLFVVIKLLVDFDRPVGTLLGFAATLIKRATRATAAFVFFDLRLITRPFMRLLIAALWAKCLLIRARICVAGRVVTEVVF